MQTVSDSSQSADLEKVNWAGECMTGAMLSAIFTVMSAHAGAEGVVEGSFAEQFHTFITLGGFVMAVLCGVAGLSVLLYQLLNNLVRKNFSARPAGNLQTAKFLKIFLP
jgi:hypothetical protein